MGYGIVTVLAHRLAYELTYGPIPEGLTLHHICETTDCVNPDHLQPVTHAQNLLASDITLPGKNIRKTHCPQGHPYSPENTYRFKGHGRECRICTIRNVTEAHRRHIAKKRALHDEI